MDVITMSLGQALCNVATAGTGSAQCYNAAAMQTLGNCLIVVVVLVTIGYRALSRL
jgi:hypothetical protein